MLRLFFAILSFSSLSFSAPLDCQKLTKPLDPFDALQQASGRWALVAGSVKDGNGSLIPLERLKSLRLDLGKSSFTQFIRTYSGCWPVFSNFTLEGHVLKTVIEGSNHIVTFFHTSCPDCRLLNVEEKSSTSRGSEGLYLFSKRREVKLDEITEFESQAECLNFPEIVEMNPAEELC